jgi:hypothetical protein
VVLVVGVLAGCKAEPAEPIEGVVASATSGDRLQGDDFTLSLPDGFRGVTSKDELNRELSITFPEEDIEPFVDALFLQESELVAWNDNEPALQNTVLVFHVHKTKEFPLLAWTTTWGLNAKRQGAVPVGGAPEKLTIDGRPATRIRFDDPVIGVRTDAYVIVDGKDAWFLEYSAPQDEFAGAESGYRESAESFSLS